MPKVQKKPTPRRGLVMQKQKRELRISPVLLSPGALRHWNPNFSVGYIVEKWLEELREGLIVKETDTTGFTVLHPLDGSGIRVMLGVLAEGGPNQTPPTIYRIRCVCRGSAILDRNLAECVLVDSVPFNPVRGLSLRERLAASLGDLLVRAIHIVDRIIMLETLQFCAKLTGQLVTEETAKALWKRKDESVNYLKLDAKAMKLWHRQLLRITSGAIGAEFAETVSTERRVLARRKKSKSANRSLK